VGVDLARPVARGRGARSKARLARPWWVWIRRALDAVVLALLCGAAIWLAVRVTPLQSVDAAGQRVQVGATSPHLTGSGPGELDLFGQAIATKPRFEGPIRPRLRLTHITMDAQVAALVRAGDHGRLSLSGRLTAGWQRYCVWESLVAAGFAALLMIAATAVRRWPRRTKATVVALGVLSVILANSTGVYLLASSTPRALKRVKSIDDLVGQSPEPAVPTAQGPPLRKVRAVVIGDSTAAAIGNPPVDKPDALDRACGRSRDSYAAYLAEANGWNILNLACSGATVRDGLLGVQITGDQVAPPQLSVAQRASSASVVIVSVGANDVHWADLTRLCVAANACNDQASTAYFQQQLDGFTNDYYQLLQQLAALPQHPTVLVNQYYDPLGQDLDCLKPQGFTPAMAAALHSRLTDLNAVLGNGARTFGFTPVPQHFSDHELCTDRPFVQGPGAEAPLHPTAAGELAIALADQQALATQSSQATPSP
jgi:lysophospholipase L1-like esterase